MQKPKLSEHKKVGDTLETPWLSGDIGRIWNLSSWSRDLLPEYLWIALIFDKYGRDRGLLIFSKILEECKCYKLYSSKISLITKMTEERQKKFYEIIDMQDVMCYPH